MAVRVAINGFGRIGRMILRSLIEADRKDVDVCAINDLAPPDALAHLLAYDSIHGASPAPVRLRGKVLHVAGRRIGVLSERNPAQSPWGEMGVDVVLECTGLFANADAARAHLNAGARRVLVSAPALGADATLVYGVNHTTLRARHKIISNASCTTNCLAPVLMVLDKLCGVENGHMTTVHAYTSDQRLQDGPHSDPRRARAALGAMIPTSTGAARAIGEVLPNLAGKIEGGAVRVPTPNVSMIDLVIASRRPVSADAVNAAMEKAAQTKLKGVLGVSAAPLVSSDFNHNPLSSIFDLTQTRAIGTKLLRVLSWYDNEWGFANRMLDMAAHLGGARATAKKRR